MPKVTHLVSNRAWIRVKTRYGGYQEREGFLKEVASDLSLQINRGNLNMQILKEGEIRNSTDWIANGNLLYTQGGQPGAL